MDTNTNYEIIANSSKKSLEENADLSDNDNQKFQTIEKDQ